MATPFNAALDTFIGDKGFLKQRERAVKGKYANKGFVDSSFEAMMRKVGWKGGEEWCAYFVKLMYMQMYSFDRAWLSKNLSGGSNRNLSKVKSAYNMGDKRYIPIYTDTPEVADVFVLEKGNTSRGHTGIITEVLGYNDDGSVKVKTIEGNTSLAGIRDGQGVFQLTRNLKIGGLTPGREPKFMRGYFRRNFNPIQKLGLKYDENQQTFILDEQAGLVKAIALAGIPTFT
jgi:hypothetical protein